MSELLNQIIHVIENVILVVGYPGIFFTTLLENVFPPLPTEAIMPFVGILAADGKINLAGAWMAALLGHVAGALLQYSLGVWAGEHLIRRFIQNRGHVLRTNEAALDRSLALFRRYGGSTILFARALPVAKAVISLTAGVSRMSLPTFVIFTTIGAASSTTLWLGLGYILRDNWTLVVDLLHVLQPLFMALIVMGVLIAIYVVLRRLNRRS